MDAKPDPAAAGVDAKMSDPGPGATGETTPNAAGASTEDLDCRQSSIQIGDDRFEKDSGSEGDCHLFPAFATGKRTEMCSEVRPGFLSLKDEIRGIE